MKIMGLLSALFIMAASCGGGSAPEVESFDSTAVAARTDSIAVDAPTTTTPEGSTTPSHMDDAAEGHMDEDDHTTDAHTSDMSRSAMNVGLADEGAIADRTIEVVMTEFAFEPGPINVVAGETIEFLVHNEGAIQHDFRVTTQEAIDHHLVQGHADHSDGMEPGVMLLDPGHSGSMLVTFHQGGEFDMIACLIPAHYEAGMATELNIDG